MLVAYKTSLVHASATRSPVHLLPIHPRTRSLVMGQTPPSRDLAQHH